MAAPVPKWAVWDGKRFVEDPNPSGAVWKYRTGSLTMEPTTNANKTLDDVVVVHPYTHEFIRYRQFMDRFGGTGSVYVPPDIVWEDPTAVQAMIDAANNAGQDTLVITGRNIRATPAMMANHTRLLNIPYNGTKVLFYDSRFECTGDIVGRYRMRVGFYNCWGNILPPVKAGSPSGYVVNGDQAIWLEVVGCTFPRMGRGIFVQGNDLSKTFQGDPAAGDHVLITRNIAYNMDGRYSDGNGGYVLSPYSTTNNPPNGTVVGGTVGNFLRVNECPGVPLECSYNIIINESGKSRPEDVITFQGGSGGLVRPDGTVEVACLVKKNFVVNPGAWDPTFVDDGSDLTYIANSNGSGWTAQAGTPGYSGTAILVGDHIFGYRHDDYRYNSCGVTVDSNYAIGFRPLITTQGGHHNTFTNNKMYKTLQVFNRPGVVYSPAPSPFYQVTDYHNGDTAPYNGQQYVIWGFNTFTGNIIYNRSPATGATGTLTLSADASKNGSTSTGNLQLDIPNDPTGGAAFAEYQAMVAADGVTIGSTLPILS